MNTKKYIFALATGLALLFSGSIALAQNETPESAFFFYEDIAATTIKVPTVLEMTFRRADLTLRESFLVWDATDGRFIPSLYRPQIPERRYVVTPDLIIAKGTPGDLVDGNYGTYAEFGLPEKGEGLVEITLTSDVAVPVSGFTFLLGNSVALPTFASVSVDQGEKGERYAVLRDLRLAGPIISFPETVGRVWHITLRHAQPLRIEEIRVAERGSESSQGVLRFLAVPNHAYRIYGNGDRQPDIFLPESGDLWTDKDVRGVAAGNLVMNPLYRPADYDKDGVPDMGDNCTAVANKDQADIDQNRVGDACDDFDRDGVLNVKDNCPNEPNYAQTDTDGDGMGDVCDKEESRFTEAHKWVPWAGMGAAALVLLVLVVLTIRSGGLPKNESNV